MTTQERVAKLVQRLNERTNVGDLVWEETSQPYVFQAAFTNLIVKLGSYDLEGGGVEYYIALFNESGLQIDRLTALELLQVSTSSYNLLKNLYLTAKRQALAVDAALDALIGELS